MKKRIITFIFALFLIVPICLTLTACKDKNKEDPTPQPQVTMMQISEALDGDAKPTIEGSISVRLVSSTPVSEQTFYNYKNILERYNFNSNNLVAADHYEYWAIIPTLPNTEQPEYSIYVFKFSNNYATEFNQNFDFDTAFEADYNSKVYGDLVVVADVTISTFVFNTIDSIQV